MRVEDLLGGRQPDLNGTDRLGAYTGRGARRRRAIDLADIDAQALVHIGSAVSLILCMGYALGPVVASFTMCGGLCGDELGKKLVMRAGACIRDGSNKKSRRNQNRVDPAPIPELLDYRWVGCSSHRGSLTSST